MLRTSSLIRSALRTSSSFSTQHHNLLLRTSGSHRNYCCGAIHASRGLYAHSAEPSSNVAGVKLPAGSPPESPDSCSNPHSHDMTPLKANVRLPHFDVCIIGGGPAGIAAALRAVDYNKRVVIIERDRIGGRDLWKGTLGSKIMWEMSNFFTKLAGENAGRMYPPPVSKLTSSTPTPSPTTTLPSANPLFVEHSHKGPSSGVYDCFDIDEEALQETLTKSSEQVEGNMLTALKAANVEIVYGSGSFNSPTELSVHNRETMEYRVITADYFIVASGSRPRKHPMFRLDKERVVTSDEIMSMPIPKSIVIVGSGVLGCEFASMYAKLGKTKVYLIDKSSRILPMEDNDLSDVIMQQLIDMNVTLHHDSALFDLQSWEEDDKEMAEHPEDPTRRSGVQYTVINKHTGELTTFNVEKALISIGRDPNYTGLGLGTANCRVRDGKLLVDAFGRCEGSDHIYAVGDATVDIALVNMGELEGRTAVDHMYGCRIDDPSVIDNLSRAYFLTSAMAGVGLNEKQCRQRNIAYTVGRYQYGLLSRAVAASNTVGLVKIIVANDKTKTLLGVRAVGFHATSIVEFASIAIHNKSSAYDLLNLLPAYPSMSQAFLECVRMILGESILKPEAFPDLLEVRSWYPENYEHGRAYQKTMIKKQKEREAREEKISALEKEHVEEVERVCRESKSQGKDGEENEENATREVEFSTIPGSFFAS